MIPIKHCRCVHPFSLSIILPFSQSIWKGSNFKTKEPGIEPLNSYNRLEQWQPVLFILFEGQNLYMSSSGGLCKWILKTQIYGVRLFCNLNIECIHILFLYQKMAYTTYHENSSNINQTFHLLPSKPDVGNPILI